MRRSAATIAIVVVAIVLPYFLTVAAVCRSARRTGLLRITPAAGFALQQAYPTYAQVNGVYTPWNGYYPLASGRAWRCWRLGRRSAGRRGLPAAPTGRLMSDALHAEWTKLRTLSSTWWLLLAAVALTIVVGAAVAAGGHCAPGACAPGQTGADPAKISLTGIDLGQAIVAAAGRTGGRRRVQHRDDPGDAGRDAAAADRCWPPRRWSSPAGRLAAGAVAVLGSLLAGRLILPGHGLTAANGYLPLSLGDGPDLRAAVGAVLYLALIALLALGSPLPSATPPSASAWSSRCCTCSRSSAR